jgi:hypothetical protein
MKKDLEMSRDFRAKFRDSSVSVYQEFAVRLSKNKQTQQYIKDITDELTHSGVIDLSDIVNVENRFVTLAKPLP